MQRFIGVVLALALAGCTGSGAGPHGGQPEKLRDDIPEPPEGGAQIVSQAFEVPAGEEVFMCMRVPFEVKERLLVQSSQVYQTTNGHHTVVFYSEDSEGVNPEPHECSGFDMTNVRLIGTGAANGSGIEMPDGVALEVPAGAEVWIQSHYINATEQNRMVQDVVNLELLEESEVEEIAGTFAHLDLTFQVPPHEQETTTIDCEFDREMTIPWLLPHMHEWGESFALEVLRDGEELYSWSGPWLQSFRDDFPVQELDESLQVKPGDVLRTTCTWRNTETEPLLWPKEMCVTFFPYYPGDGSLLACDENGDMFSP